MFIAAAGFVLSLAAHLMALAGVNLPSGGLVWLLHVGIFIVWIPAISFVNQNVKQMNRKRGWEELLAICPAWMRWMSGAVVAYAAVNFVLFLVSTNGQPKPTGTAPPIVVRGFSGHWMVFYWAAFVTFYATLKVRRRLSTHRSTSRMEEGIAHENDPKYRGRHE